MERQFRSLTITADEEVKIKVAEIAITAGEEGNEEGADDQIKEDRFGIESFRPMHKDFTDALKKLRKFALEVLEVEVDGKDINQWRVSGLKISGDLLTKKSRCVMILSHYAKRTGKWADIKTSQVTMYPSDEEKVKYENADKMTPVIESVVDEALQYLNGKHAEDFEPQEGQLALFPKRELETA